MMKTTTYIQTKSFNLAVYQKGSAKSEKLALVLPGRLDTKDYPHMRSHVDFLASKGYLALSFDPPGTWESEGDISIFITTNYIKAIQELINYFDNKPTLLVGHSRGGSMAIIAGTKFKEVEKFISIMGKASYKNKKYPEWERKGTRLHVRDTPLEYAEREKSFELSYDFVKDSWQYDSIEDLKKCTKPKFFIAGSKDTIVDKLVVEEVYEISSEPKQIYLIESKHDYRKDGNLIEEVNKIIGRFISSQ
jgi:pimeloyl-ACP methyl ester carboxylesterase